MRLRLSAVWVTMVAFEAPVPVAGGMEGAHTYVYNTYQYIPLSCGNTIGWLETGGTARVGFSCGSAVQVVPTTPCQLLIAARVFISGMEPGQLIACATHVGACMQVPLCKAVLC